MVRSGDEWIPDQVGDDKSRRKGMDSLFHGDDKTT